MTDPQNHDQYQYQDPDRNYGNEIFEILRTYYEIAKTIFSTNTKVYHNVTRYPHTIQFRLSLNSGMKDYSTFVVEIPSTSVPIPNPIPVSLAKLLEFYRQTIHTMTELNGYCILPLCLCLTENNPTMYFHQLFWRILDYMTDSNHQLALQLLATHFNDQSKKRQQTNSDPKLEPLIQCLNDILSSELQKLDWKNITNQSLFATCFDEGHTFSKTETIWKSNYAISVSENLVDWVTQQDHQDHEEATPIPNPAQVPAYRILCQSCDLCNEKYYLPQHFTPEHTDPEGQKYLPVLPAQGSFDVLEAFMSIFEDVLPPGQILVVAKLLARITLSDTERNVKSQVKRKMLKLQRLHVMWDDLWSLFSQE